MNDMNELDDMNELNDPIFNQLSLFANELLRMIDEGQTASIVEVCDNIEQGTITEFIDTNYSFKSLHVTLERIADVNKVLKGKYVSEDEAHKYGINNNGLVFLMLLIVGDLKKLFYDMKFNRIDPESYRLDM